MSDSSVSLYTPGRLGLASGQASGQRLAESGTGNAGFGTSSDPGFDDLRLILQTQGAEAAAWEIASAVWIVPGAKSVSGDPYRMGWAWQATPRAVHVWEIRQALTRVGGNSFRPVGAWIAAGARHFAFTAAPKKREGIIPTVSASSPVAASPSPTVFGPTVEPQRDPVTEKARQTLRYLPSVVQQFCLQSVPEPEFCLGELYQWVKDGLPYKQRLVYVRVGAGRAVIVTGVKSIAGQPAPPGVTAQQAQAMIAAQPWTVVQTYGPVTGTQTVAALGGSQARQIGG